MFGHHDASQTIRERPARVGLLEKRRTHDLCNRSESVYSTPQARD
jgi:hypothetical protein